MVTASGYSYLSASWAWLTLNMMLVVVSVHVLFDPDLLETVEGLFADQKQLVALQVNRARCGGCVWC